MAENSKQPIPAYCTYKSFTNFINDLRSVGTPPHITRSVPSGSNSAKSMMMAALKYLDLIDGSSAPTNKLTQLVDNEEDYSINLNILLEQQYPFLFDEGINIGNTTTEKVAERFRSAGASGSTISKCMSFFLAAAKDAGLEVSQRVKAPAIPRSAPKRKNNGQDHSTFKGNSNDDPPEDEIPEGMERITIPLRNMEDGIIYFPENLEPEDAKRAIKMSMFILNQFYEMDDD